MSQSQKKHSSPSRAPRWIFIWSLFVLALGIVALVFAERSSTARTVHEDRLLAQEEKLEAFKADLQAQARKMKEEQQKLVAQKDELLALRRSSFQVTRQPITLDKTGNEVCNEHGEVCIAVTPSKAFDAMDRFCGYNMIDCNSRIRPLEGCGKTASGDIYNYQFDRTSFAHSPGAEGTCEQQARPCLKEPFHNDAICTSDISDRADSRQAPPPQ
jgi:hypothetical protein